jgi:type VI secretion system FHA domain protein
MLRLKIVKGTELAEGVVAEVPLPEPLTRFSIGRDPGNHWPIPDRTLAISARHCEVVATAAGPALRDLSTNGTFVNGSTVRLAGDHALQDGDRFDLGPYTILVQGPPAREAAAPAAHADVSLPLPGKAPAGGGAVRPAAAAASARGGDPAAMLAAGAPERPGVTEMLRSTPPPEATNVEVTKIRLAPRPTTPVAPSAPASAPVSAPQAAMKPMPPVPPPRAAPAPPPAPGAAPAPTPSPAPPAADAWLEHLARGLGLAPEALAGRDPAQAAAQAGALARAAVTVLRSLLEQQALGRRQIGSRSPALQPVRDVNPLRLAATPEAALKALLAPGASVEVPLQRAAAELAAHQDRMMAAFRAAATQLGEEISPTALQQALPGADDDEHKARLWELYTQLWQGIGLASGQPWSKGFLEAALLHLAVAYDQPAAKP